MSSYYELRADIRLKPVEEIGLDIHVLLLLLFKSHEAPEATNVNEKACEWFPDHPFWKQERYMNIGYAGISSLWNNNDRPDYQHPLLKVRCEINYGRQEILMFLDWLTPYVDSMVEPGGYHDEHMYDRCIERTVVTFEPDPSGTKRFLFTKHKVVDGGWAGRETKEEKEWIEDYRSPKQTPDYRQKR